MHNIYYMLNGDMKREKIFVTGGAGTGKTFLFNLLKNHVNRCYGKPVVKVGALTGVAARLIGGTTLHRLLKLPVQNDGVIVSMPLLTALRRRREADKHVTDPCQLSLRFARPRSRHAIRTRGIPTFLLGHFEDQPLDNSEEFQAHSQTGKVNDHNSETNIRTSNSSNRHQSQRRIQKQDTTPLLHKEEELLCNTVAELKSSDNTINNDITPPPGAPKLENSARLRRYRHNID